MTTLIKTLNITNAELNVITAGRRLPLARFAGKIEIKEIKNITPILGRQCKGEKIIHASFMLCEDIEYQIQNEFNSGKVYEALPRLSLAVSLECPAYPLATKNRGCARCGT